jgi:plastocyanin
MKPAKYTLFASSVVTAIIGLHFAGKPAPADSPSPVAAAAPATVPATAPQSAAASVRIDNFAFSPKELVITAGTTVTWQNADDVPHTATSKGDPQVFDSGALDTDDKFSFTFSKPGKYTYYCKVHPHMTGVITVK